MSKPSELYNLEYKSAGEIAALMMGAIFDAFDPSKGDNGYECHNYEINENRYCIERDVNDWYWGLGYKTDGIMYSTLTEALQAAINHAAAEEAKSNDGYNFWADIREQEGKELRTSLNQLRSPTNPATLQARGEL